MLSIEETEKILLQIDLNSEGWVTISLSLLAPIRFLDRQVYYKAFQEFNMLGKTEIMNRLFMGTW